MVNEISKRPAVFLENAVFYFSFLLLLMVVVGFFYFRSAANRASAEVAAFEAQLVKMKTGDQKELENRIVAARRRLSDFSKIMKDRDSAGVFFSEFENMVFPGVYYSKLNLDFLKKNVSLSGHAKNFSDVGRQGIKFSAAKDMLIAWPFAKITINEDGNVDFDVNLSIDPSVKNFKYAQ